MMKIALLILSLTTITHHHIIHDLDSYSLRKPDYSPQQLTYRIQALLQCIFTPHLVFNSSLNMTCPAILRETT